jgi:glucose-1-phosphate cytidylyltransferase
MKVAILAGGLGTRMREETEVKPKPMVEIGGSPILWHIMKTYSGFGYQHFVVALGYKGEVIKDYFLNYRARASNLSIRLSDGQIDMHGADCDPWMLDLIETGDGTMTGGRVKRLQPWIGRETFMLTYGDGVADVDLNRLLAFHREQGRLATVTAVRPPARFGGLRFEGERVAEFVEKPQIGEGWINGGFFVFEPEIFDYIEGDETFLEREPLERLAAEGQLAAYRHDGFWQCMDTIRDVKLLEGLWERGDAPWKSWK